MSHDDTADAPLFVAILRDCVADDGPANEEGEPVDVLAIDDDRCCIATLDGNLIRTDLDSLDASLPIRSIGVTQ